MKQKGEAANERKTEDKNSLPNGELSVDGQLTKIPPRKVGTGFL